IAGSDEKCRKDGDMCKIGGKRLGKCKK
ncbi:unnamed protein product, partial [Allacma fusca]